MSRDHVTDWMAEAVPVLLQDGVLTEGVPDPEPIGPEVGRNESAPLVSPFS